MPTRKNPTNEYEALLNSIADRQDDIRKCNEAEKTKNTWEFSDYGYEDLDQNQRDAVNHEHNNLREVLTESRKHVGGNSNVLYESSREIISDSLDKVSNALADLDKAPPSSLAGKDEEEIYKDYSKKQLEAIKYELTDLDQFLEQVHEKFQENPECVVDEKALRDEGIAKKAEETKSFIRDQIEPIKEAASKPGGNGRKVCHSAIGKCATSGG